MNNAIYVAGLGIYFNVQSIQIIRAATGYVCHTYTVVLTFQGSNAVTLKQSKDRGECEAFLEKIRNFLLAERGPMLQFNGVSNEEE